MRASPGLDADGLRRDQLVEILGLQAGRAQLDRIGAGDFERRDRGQFVDIGDDEAGPRQLVDRRQPGIDERKSKQFLDIFGNETFRSERRNEVRVGIEPASAGGEPVAEDTAARASAASGRFSAPIALFMPSRANRRYGRPSSSLARVA